MCLLTCLDYQLQWRSSWLVRRHGDHLAVAALHPGVVRTDIGRHFPRLRVAAAQAFAISPKRSARYVAALATDPLPRNGRYFDRDAEARSSRPSYDLDAARRLWTITERICGPFGHAVVPSTINADDHPERPNART
jgi:hypothetical protein